MDYGNDFMETASLEGASNAPFHSCGNGLNFTMDMHDVQLVLLHPSRFMQLVNFINGLICFVGLSGNILVVKKTIKLI